MKIEKSATAWQQYAQTPPPDAEMLGVVTIGGVTGALARIKRADGYYRYVMASNDAQHPLDGRTVAAALGHAGRKKLGSAMQSVQVNLSTEDVAFCRSLSGGNLSAGVRMAIGMGAFFAPDNDPAPK